MVVITRHKALVEFLRELGVVGEDAKVIAHATPEDVMGEVVVGVIPLHLAALAKEVVVPVMELRPEDRGRELGLEEVRQRFRAIKRYKVEEIG